MKKGFTLIELLISITIGMMMVGIGTVSINNFYEEQKMNSISDELISNLKLARNFAITNQFPNEPSGGDRVVGTLTDGLLVFGVQTSSNIGVGESFLSKQIVPQGVGVTLSNNFGGNVAVKFSVSEGRSIGDSATITINNNKRFKKIIIEESGRIYEE